MLTHKVRESSVKIRLSPSSLQVCIVLEQPLNLVTVILTTMTTIRSSLQAIVVLIQASHVHVFETSWLRL